MSDLKTILGDVESILQQTADATGERALELRTKALHLLKQAKGGLLQSQAVLLEKTKKAACAADEYVHEHPWKSIAGFVALGAVIGLLLNRR
jgi:ElaB/YqjD/DUF883 family membrane-anchored ribosome-binding protein